MTFFSQKLYSAFQTSVGVKSFNCDSISIIKLTDTCSSSSPRMECLLKTFCTPKPPATFFQMVMQSFSRNCMLLSCRLDGHFAYVHCKNCTFLCRNVPVTLTVPCFSLAFQIGYNIKQKHVVFSIKHGLQ